ALDGELCLALEHVERVDLVVVRVRLDAFELLTEGELDHLELGELGEDPVAPAGAGDVLAAVRAVDDPWHTEECSIRTYVRVEHVCELRRAPCPQRLFVPRRCVAAGGARGAGG